MVVHDVIFYIDFKKVNACSSSSTFYWCQWNDPI